MAASAKEEARYCEPVWPCPASLAAVCILKTSGPQGLSLDWVNNIRLACGQLVKSAMENAKELPLAQRHWIFSQEMSRPVGSASM